MRVFKRRSIFVSDELIFCERSEKGFWSSIEGSGMGGPGWWGPGWGHISLFDSAAKPPVFEKSSFLKGSEMSPALAELDCRAF
ncbi:MAG: hypothetical protein DMG06_10390 [Acidobacteria bacterium]|nr:MAG: hypothetical protein DMG06_10390 [Acidobacteriota bacterium]